jgi:hypothetical protein
LLLLSNRYIYKQLSSSNDLAYKYDDYYLYTLIIYYYTVSFSTIPIYDYPNDNYVLPYVTYILYIYINYYPLLFYYIPYTDINMI